MSERFEDMLAGGHPNSLGRTIKVVDTVLADLDRFTELFACYVSADQVVRLRVSNAMKRVEKERHDLLVPYIDRLLSEIGALDQPSAQWTLADIFAALAPDMNPDQKFRARHILQRNLANHEDWIALNRTMDTFVTWARTDEDLADWLAPHIRRLQKDPRKSVSKRAGKARVALGQA